MWYMAIRLNWLTVNPGGCRIKKKKCTKLATFSKTLIKAWRAVPGDELDNKWVSPDPRRFRWLHETHGGSFATANASCPLDRSGAKKKQQQGCYTCANHVSFTFAEENLLFLDACSYLLIRAWTMLSAHSLYLVFILFWGKVWVWGRFFFFPLPPPANFCKNALRYFENPGRKC